MTDDRSSKDGESSPVLLSPNPDEGIRLPKNRSTGNLFLQQTEENTDKNRMRFSFDATTSSEYDHIPRSPLLEHEHGLGKSGLNRIRRLAPSSRVSTLPSSPDSSFAIPNLTHTATMPTTTSSSRSASAFGAMGPTTPAIEDLQRFPSESLHSFSFAHQSEEMLHTRQNILKKSLDFMRDRLGWAANNPGIATAQAKVSGDAEIQSMMDLLSRANILGKEATQVRGLGLSNGPLTGPADMDAANIFEKSFSQQDSHLNTTHEAVNEDEEEEDKPSPVPDVGLLISPATDEDAKNQIRDMKSAPASRRASLKRTYTDISSVSLQSKLMDALAQPYEATDRSISYQHLSPSGAPPTGIPSPLWQNPAGSSVHQKWVPAAQAVFRTEAKAPWTILAANDLACLVFGVTRAEVRKLGIMEVVQPERRQWLEEKLRGPEQDSIEKVRTAPEKPPPNGATPKSPLSLGSGVTAKLLSKPPSRQKSTRRAQTDDGSGSSFSRPRTPKNHPPTKSRGVLLCGDVVPILKRNGSTGSASFWVMEKRAGLIWVLEEITENVAYVRLDTNACVMEAKGDTEAIWGKGTVNPGLSITKLLPRVPPDCITSCDDAHFSKITEMRHFTARTAGGLNIPATVTQVSGPRDLRISSFPHIAGIMVLSPSTLKITSSNSVFSAALFGQEEPDGKQITDLIPDFEGLLHVLTEEDNVQLADGIVIPEHSFRRARALLALREGKMTAASIFLRPSGLPARHRDGAEIMVDVQMRVVRSETFFPHRHDHMIPEAREEHRRNESGIAVTELVYALWITYSRQLHAADVAPGKSANPIPVGIGTPPHQPSPGQQSQPVSPLPPPPIASPKPVEDPELTLKIQEATSESLPDEPLEHPANLAAPKGKKSIAEFIILEEMGQGAYGQVKLARYKSNNSKKVVLKYVTKRRILVDTWTRDRRLGTVPLEIHVLDYLRRDGLRHPNIVEMIDFFEDDTNYYIEMVPHGIPGMDLFDYIELRANMEEAECRNIFKQVVSAIHHLHTKALVVHRDIKDENVILDGEGRIKLIDFGSAAYIKNGPFDVFVGTIDYAAPEVLQGKSYRGKEQDVWALGILLYTIVYKENPFYNIDEILDHPLRIPFLPFSEECIDLVKRMLDRDVDERISITEVMEHPWLMDSEDDDAS